jgi:glycosyltransferase involved in cell wall biosynthesis
MDWRFVTRPTPGAANAMRFISVGTICERKGQHTLVEAAAILAKSRRDFAVHLVGAREGIPYLDYVRQLIARHRLESIVRLIPETDAKPFYRAADAFVCTSHMETYSRSILEAEAFGLAIVSTPCQGIGEQVFWGFNALTFPFSDAIELADRMKTVMEDRDLRERMGRTSRAAFELHPSFDAMLDSFESVFRIAAGPAFCVVADQPATALRKAA